MNKIMILANLTRDCEIKYAQSGTAIGSFSIAYNEKRKDQSGNYVDVTHFFDCTAFGKTAENINKFFSKGSRILLEGSLDYQTWEKDGQKRSKVGVKVMSFDFIDRKSDTQPTQPAQNNYSKPSPNQQATIPSINIDEDQIPFRQMEVV